MINHARTLLLNKSASYSSGLLNDTYVPEEFKPLILTPFLSNVRDAVIPLTGSRQQEIDVVNIVMQILHSPDLAPYTLQFDKRITYTAKNYDPGQFATSHVALQSNKSSDCDVIPKYEYVFDSLLKPLAGVYTWSVSSVDARNVRVTNTKDMSEVVNLNPTSTSPKSLPVDIIPGYMSIYFELPALQFTGSFTFNYSLTVRASYDLVAAEAALKQAFLGGTGIFDYADFPDIMPVLRDTWLHNPAMVTRFGAGVLAYIYTLEGMRK